MPGHRDWARKQAAEEAVTPATGWTCTQPGLAAPLCASERPLDRDVPPLPSCGRAFGKMRPSPRRLGTMSTSNSPDALVRIGMHLTRASRSRRQLWPSFSSHAEEHAPSYEALPCGGFIPLLAATSAGGNRHLVVRTALVIRRRSHDAWLCATADDALHVLVPLLVLTSIVSYVLPSQDDWAGKPRARRTL